MSGLERVKQYKAAEEQKWNNKKIEQTGNCILKKEYSFNWSFTATKIYDF